MKKILTIILAIVLATFMFVGCGPKTPDSGTLDLTQYEEDSPAATAAPVEASPSLTPAQEVWNGDWFGYMWVTSTKGAYSHLEDDVYNAFLFIDLNENDEGTLEIYLEDDDYPIVKANVIADDYHIEAVDGIFKDTELDARMWWARFDEDLEGHQILIADNYDDPEGDGSFHYMLVFRPWGEPWEQEEREGMRMPPGYADYVASLESGGSGGGGGTSTSAPATGGNAVVSPGAAGTLSVAVPASGWGHMVFESAISDPDPYGVKVFLDTGDDYDSLFSLGLSISVFQGGQMFEMNIKKSDFKGVKDLPQVSLGNYTWNGYTGDYYDVPTTLLWTEDGSDIISVQIGLKNSKQELSLDDADVKAIISSITLSR